MSTISKEWERSEWTSEGKCVQKKRRKGEVRRVEEEGGKVQETYRRRTGGEKLV